MKSLVTDLISLLNDLKRYSYPFQETKQELPKNGVYLMFENGEKYLQYDRIVRVGTHTGNNQLYPRLLQHYVVENKNRSIFRKNIGRCILYMNNHPYLKIWELKITSAENKKLYSQAIDHKFEQEIEKQISNYMQNNLSFCVFQVDTKDQRLYWESKIISTFAQSCDVRPSANWLGKYSPKEKIRNSGLWEIKGLNGKCLNNEEFIYLKKIVHQNIIDKNT